MQGFQPSLLSWEAGGWAVVSPGRLGAGFQPQLVCPSVRKNLTSQKVSVPSWHWSCGLPRARGWWCQAKEREGGVDLPYNKCSLEETGRMSPQPMDEETEARDREITCSGHFMGGDDGTAGWIRVWPSPLSPVPLCMERAGRAKKSRGPSGEPAALDLCARLSKKQTV